MMLKVGKNVKDESNVVQLENLLIENDMKGLELNFNESINIEKNITAKMIILEQLFLKK